MIHDEDAQCAGQPPRLDPRPAEPDTPADECHVRDSLVTGFEYLIPSINPPIRTTAMWHGGPPSTWGQPDRDLQPGATSGVVGPITCGPASGRSSIW